MTKPNYTNESPLIIRASAGTGKTYRLSLEFINLLLKYRINFDEILVITFTKKATAEIRERIFSQLYEIINNTSEGKELALSIRENINPEIKFDKEEMTFLKSVYENMITNKAAVKISTIDSFVNTIFSGIIAPYKNIIDFSIDNKINEEILPEIYEHILKDKNLKNYEKICLQAKRRNLDQFKNLILSIIENRWLFEFIDLSILENVDFDIMKANAFKKFENSLRDFLQLLQSEIIAYTKPAEIKDLLQKDFASALENYLDFSELRKEYFLDSLFDILTENAFTNAYYKILLEDKNIWNGSRIRNKALKDHYQTMQTYLAQYLYFEKALEEQFNIISLAANIVQVYDDIKFRDKIFTHSDISYYTFKFLYDKELSIIEKGNVLNIFYEQLSYNSRFVLIDEFQDTSILQWSIFYPMLKEITSGIGQKEYGKIIVVGDEKQAIYGWRGGERKLLTAFEKILNEPVEYDTLSTSYRSKPVLMKWLNTLFRSDLLQLVENWDYTEIDCFKSEDGFVQVDFRNRQESERKIEKHELFLEYVLQNLKTNLDYKKINPADTAVIMRTNKDLAIMAQVLEETGIDFTLEMSGSLFHHKAIKPILFLLKFLVYDDFMELIKFLRSDLVLLETNDLRQIINEYHSCDSINDFLLNCKIHPYLEKLFKLKKAKSPLLVLIRTILEEFGITKVFASEIDLKNLQRFLEVAAEFERTNHDYTVDLSGFLQYCRALADKDEYSQIGQSLSDSIKLMTIHKSKGLQFETVFTVFDVTGKSGGNNSGLKLYYKFAENFRSLDDFAFTYNYDKILRKSEKSSLIDYVEKRDFSDEMNNVYVALTRAKNNLFILLHYKKKGDLEKLFKELRSDNNVTKLVAKTIYNEFQDDIKEVYPVLHQIKIGSISTNPKEEISQQLVKLGTTDFFQVSKPDLQGFTETNLLKLSNEFLNNKSILIGNFVHEYLSHITYNSAQEIKIAKDRTISKYGSLIKLSELSIIIEKIQGFVLENINYFDKSKWDKVFNEFVVFDENGHEFRIDRLLINTKVKQILIIDYKTGSHYEEEQLDNYRQIVEKLPMVKRSIFKIESVFLEIKLN